MLSADWGMDLMKMRCAPLSKSNSNRRCEMDNPSTRRQRSTLFFNWHIRATLKERIMRNVNFRLFFCVSVISLVSTGLIFAGQSARQNQTSETAPAASAALANTTSATEIVDRIVSREQALTTRMKSLHPLVETYLQQLDKDDELAFRPVS